MNATVVSSLILCDKFVSASNPRRSLRPRDNVGEMVRQYRGRDVVIKDRYTIHTEIQEGSEKAGTELAMDVVEASHPAVTLDTIIKDERGNEFSVGDNILLYTLLVTDVDTVDGADTFAMLAINPETNDMHGLVEKKGKRGERVPYTVKQSKGENEGIAMAQEQIELPPSDWHCDVAEEVPSEEESIERRLMSGARVRPLVHKDSIQHGHHNHHGHGDQDKGISAMDALRNVVRGIKVNPLNKPRRLQTASYNFEVEMYIEIDNTFVNNLGSLSNAVNYVNTLVTGANVVYEKEIDTHLRVTNIVVSTLYDGATSTSDALSIMRTNYGGNTWHAANVDIHHALLGKLGGGIAYIGVVCRSDWGFGLTGGLSGSFTSMGQPVVWDMKGFMHEVGHNFGSGHSHDTNYYDPVIDSCGIACPTTVGYGWSTIMSYCQWCPGSYGNIMYSFGADYDGSGDVNDLTNWPANPNMVANYDQAHQSVDPGREAQKMYLHVVARAPSGCVALSSPAPQSTPPPTLSPTSSIGVSSFCDSGSLLNSRDSIGGASEPNGPNTLDACTDGASGNYHADESIDNDHRFRRRRGQVGATVQIVAKVWAYSATSDFIDFFYATDATNPQWQLISTVNPTSSGSNSVSTEYTIGAGSLQAVRVVIRYNGVASPCPGGAYDDVDDLAFVVKAASTPPPTLKPTPLPTLKPTPAPSSSLPTSVKPTTAPTREPTPVPILTLSPTAKPTVPYVSSNVRLKYILPTAYSATGNAYYDLELGVPKCSSIGSFCDSGSLLNSRDAIAGLSEPNSPNTLDSCTDGAVGTYHTDESIDNIRISTLDDGDFQPGSTLQIAATVWAYDPSADYADFYYATDATNPQWQFIETTKPTASGANTVSAQYALEEGNLQAVRVVFRANGVASSCPSGSYDDIDDLVFVVQSYQSVPPPTPSPNFAPAPTNRPTRMRATKLAKQLFTNTRG
ncbi:LOW QUALITY PROTEIN: hypothetical protein HJC23_012120 [Cyclotella cryptica]|uniref:Peptidase M12B domain-containing protein n=1 Tax=Cyclotella cryptica TaxID=29204 RepID=A0ABD3PJ74_9STRA